MWLGVGYRKPLARWIDSQPTEVQCLEITAEHFFDDPGLLHDLKQHYPLFLHSLGLSLGTPGPLNKNYLNRFAQVCRQADPVWISEHIAFTRVNEVDLGHLNPIPYTRETLDYFVDHALEVQQLCHKPLLLENIATHLQLPGTLAEPEFINLLCERAGCFLLLDVTNLYVNSRNHGFDPNHWLQQIQPDYIRQLHIVGYAQEGEILYDSHSENIQQELYLLTRDVIEYSEVQSIIIERDNNFPPVAHIRQELIKLGECCAA